jgi:hypothetical protein
MFTNKYNNDIKSYKGFGVVTPRYTDKLNYKNEVTNLTDKNLDYTPPLFETSFNNNPQDTNGYLNSENYIKVPKTINNYYYTAQQSDKVDKFPKYDKTNPYKFPPVLVTTEIIKEKKNKNNLKNNNKNNSKKDNNKNKESYNNKNAVLSNKLINKSWYDGRYLYSFEPRYNDVIKPDRIYTWSYPFMPNTDNYYRDDIQERGNSPIIFENIDNKEPLPDYDATSSNIENIENFENENSDNNKYIILIIFAIIIFMIKK